MIKVHIYEVATGQKVATINARKQLALKIASDVYHGKQYKKVEDDGKMLDNQRWNTNTVQQTTNVTS